MEGMASVSTATTTRGSSLQMPSSRQEWRAVAEHHFARNLDDKDQNAVASTNCGPGDQILVAEQTNSASTASSHIIQLIKHGERATNVSADSVLPEAYVPTGQANLTEIIRTSDVTLLDERALLACIVRTIPAGGQIRISSTSFCIMPESDMPINLLHSPAHVDTRGFFGHTKTASFATVRNRFAK
ncbi:hypothetical protein K1719_025325 [Acacia pycnantha]|nr:hypothetical protein K1719_025325 [Acacia pycnantha]